jgi:hypothetical protein
MGSNSKNSNDHQRTFINNSPSNKRNSPSSGSQRPSPSKSINIKTPNKNHVAGYSKSCYFNNNNNNNNNINNSATRLSLSGSPTTSYFAASKCFESPSPDSLPRPPATWFNNANNNHSSTTTSSTNKQAPRARKALVMPCENKSSSCAMEFASFSAIDKNDHFTQSLKLLLNVNA